MNSDITVTLTQDEAKFITEVIVNAPMQLAVKDMPKVIGMVQGIIGKLAHQPESPTLPN